MAIQAVGYLRASSDKQETSCSDQRKAIQAYADEHGYQIDEWYEDDGVSGDDTKRRIAFQKMIADAQDKGRFKAILVWDLKRFGRFDMIEAGFHIQPLREAGVDLVPIDEGPINWDDGMRRLMYVVQQDANNDFLKRLSRDVWRGQHEAAKNGSWAGSYPYGYRLEGPRKNKRLVLGNEFERSVVRRIFKEYVEDGRSMTKIAARLTADGIRSSGGKDEWRFDAVKCILENVAYIGTYRFNRSSRAKYHVLRGGLVVPGKHSGRNDEADWIVHENHHEPIIDRETFDKAQAILAKGKTGRSNKYHDEPNPYVLAGLLRCGRCNALMYGIDNRSKAYECKHTKFGECDGTTVHEPKVLNTIADHLESWLGLETEYLDMAYHNGGKLPDDFPVPKAFDEIKKMLLPPEKPKQDRKRLENQVAKLKAEIALMQRNLMLMNDPANIPVTENAIRANKALLTELETEVQQIKPPPSPKAINDTVLDVLRTLSSLAMACRLVAKQAEDRFRLINRNKQRRLKGLPELPERCGLFEETDPPGKIRRLLKDIDKIVVHTSMTGHGNGKRHHLEDGEIHFRQVGITTGKSNRHLLG